MFTLGLYYFPLFRIFFIILESICLSVCVCVYVRVCMGCAGILGAQKRALDPLGL